MRGQLSIALVCVLAFACGEDFSATTGFEDAAGRSSGGAGNSAGSAGVGGQVASGGGGRSSAGQSGAGGNTGGGAPSDASTSDASVSSDGAGGQGQSGSGGNGAGGAPSDASTSDASVSSDGAGGQGQSGSGGNGAGGAPSDASMPSDGAGGQNGSGGTGGGIDDAAGTGGGGGIDGAAGTGGGGGGAVGDGGKCPFPVAQYAYPDSPTTFCSNGSLAGACPSVGQANFGQDGNYLGSISTYVLTNGVVSDSMLGLEWASAFPGPQTLANAQNHCEALVLDGKDDWRLPTRFELVSIVDYGRFDPVIDVNIFAAPTGTYRSFWTRNLHASSGQDHWVVNAQEGTVVSRTDIVPAQTRCVRGAIRLSTFTELTGCSIVFDSRTGLGWQKWPTGQTFGWSDAIGYCESSEQDGFSDWRLPSVKELLSITDSSLLNPAVDGNVFPGTPAERFWTSSPYVADPSRAWTVDFWDGAAVNGSASSTPLRVRCVRGG